MKLILEQAQIVQGFAPVDLSGQANDGDWVSMRLYKHVVIKFHAGVGTAGDDPTLSIEQATDVSGAGAKALDFTTIHVKQAAVDLTGVGKWTKVTQALANTYTQADAAEQGLIWIIEFDVSQLDVNNSFSAVRGRVADVGINAQLGYLEYILSEPRYAQSADSMESAIVD